METAMNVRMPSGPDWEVVDAGIKLELRAGLPGAFVFDQAASASRNARAAGLSLADRFALSLPASWLVNSPAISPVLRRWSEAAGREAWLTMLGALEGDASSWRSQRTTERDAVMTQALRTLGGEPYVIEAASKVLAVMVPDLVPLMPIGARAFVLGEEHAAEEASFLAMIDWFTAAAIAHSAELEAVASSHGAARISGAQVLDRVLWFDSEGHQHFGVKTDP
jgi:hypothetical protein